MNVIMLFHKLGATYLVDGKVVEMPEGMDYVQSYPMFAEADPGITRLEVNRQKWVDPVPVFDFKGLLAQAIKSKKFDMLLLLPDDSGFKLSGFINNEEDINALANRMMHAYHNIRQSVERMEARLKKLTKVRDTLEQQLIWTEVVEEGTVFMHSLDKVSYLACNDEENPYFEVTHYKKLLS